MIRLGSLSGGLNFVSWRSAAIRLDVCVCAFQPSRRPWTVGDRQGLAIQTEVKPRDTSPAASSPDDKTMAGRRSGVPKQRKNATGVVSRIGASISAFQHGQAREKQRRVFVWEASTSITRQTLISPHLWAELLMPGRTRRGRIEINR